MPQVPIDGFQDTETGVDDPFQVPRQPTRAALQDRRTPDDLTTRRLFALHSHIQGLHGRVGGIEASQKQNNDMTAQILSIISGGKMIVTVIKFCGVLAVPITAIYTLWYVWTHGAPPPPGH